MAANWSKVFYTGVSTTGGCPTSCYNFTDVAAGAPGLAAGTSCNRSRGTILLDFPPVFTSCAHVMSFIGEQVAGRIGASDVTVTSSNVQRYVINLRVGNKPCGESSINVSTGTRCNYPVSATYTKGQDTGNAQFMDIFQLIDWLVIHLRV